MITPTAPEKAPTGVVKTALVNEVDQSALLQIKKENTKLKFENEILKKGVRGYGRRYEMQLAELENEKNLRLSTEVNLKEANLMFASYTRELKASKLREEALTKELTFMQMIKAELDSLQPSKEIDSDMLLNRRFEDGGPDEFGGDDPPCGSC